jgi:hypothetical protein
MKNCSENVFISMNRETNIKIGMQIVPFVKAYENPIKIEQGPVKIIIEVSKCLICWREGWRVFNIYKILSLHFDLPFQRLDAQSLPLSQKSTKITNQINLKKNDQFRIFQRGNKLNFLFYYYASKLVIANIKYDFNKVATIAFYDSFF